MLLIFRLTGPAQQKATEWFPLMVPEGTVLVLDKPASHYVSPSTSVVNMKFCQDLQIIFVFI